MPQRKPTTKSRPHKAKIGYPPLMHEGKVYPTGSDVPEGLTDEQLERLKRLGVIA